MFFEGVEPEWLGEDVNVLVLHGVDEHEVKVPDGHVAEALQGRQLDHRGVVVNKVEDRVERGAHSLRPSLKKFLHCFVELFR